MTYEDGLLLFNLVTRFMQAVHSWTVIDSNLMQSEFGCMATPGSKWEKDLPSSFLIQCIR